MRQNEISPKTGKQSHNFKKMSDYRHMTEIKIQ